MFTVSYQAPQGRIGCFTVSGIEGTWNTPLLFPVVCFMTGTTPRGGGIWKYILQANTTHGVLRRNLPVISQVLHFRDFTPLKPSVFAAWRKQTFKDHYNQQIQPALQYTAPLFLDSGGFQLLWNQGIDLTAYGLDIQDEQYGATTILELQRDFGGTFVATLDYPIPPNLASSEAIERMRRSRNNALTIMERLHTDRSYQPFLFVAAHGQDRESMRAYVQGVVEAFEEREWTNYPFGFAVGSLVPLRGSKKYPAIVNLVRGLHEGISEDLRHRLPIHTFGITGNLIPLLAYLGVDSFDSSTYVQETRSLRYFNPVTYHYTPVLELDALPCDCPICKQFNISDIHAALTSEIRYRPLPNGKYKSEYYSAIALHNLEMDMRIAEATRQAIRQDALQEYLIEHAKNYPTLQPALDAIAIEDDSLRVRLSRKIIPASPLPSLTGVSRVVSLTHTPESFNILHNGYRPDEAKRILLVIPCSSDKPYAGSRTHQFITNRIVQAYNGRSGIIHKVTLSGLYGPVPEEHELTSAVLSYDYRLDDSNDTQIALLVARMQEYLKQHGEHYDACIAYVTSKAYRTVLESVAQQNKRLLVLPTQLKARKLTEFFRQKHVAELLDTLRPILDQLHPTGT